MWRYCAAALVGALFALWVGAAQAATVAATLTYTYQGQDLFCRPGNPDCGDGPEAAWTGKLVIDEDVSGDLSNKTLTLRWSNPEELHDQKAALGFVEARYANLLSGGTVLTAFFTVGFDNNKQIVSWAGNNPLGISYIDPVTRDGIDLRGFLISNGPGIWNGPTPPFAPVPLPPAIVLFLSALGAIGLLKLVRTKHPNSRA